MDSHEGMRGKRVLTLPPHTLTVSGFSVGERRLQGAREVIPQPSSSAPLQRCKVAASERLVQLLAWSSLSPRPPFLSTCAGGSFCHLLKHGCKPLRAPWDRLPLVGILGVTVL